jgi:hypothetical protein
MASFLFLTQQYCLVGRVGLAFSGFVAKDEDAENQNYLFRTCCVDLALL